LCDLLWKTINGNHRWFVQLVNEGTPFVKPKNKLGTGIVGIDLNVSVVGIVSDSTVELREFCPELDKREKAIRVLQRQMQRKQREHRCSLHGKLANDTLRQGHHFKLEKVSVRSWQKRWGKQIGYKVPGLFQSRLIQKAESAAGIVERFSTQKTRLSQTCQCGWVQKKSLSERIHRCECGIEVPRDVYSAFLSRSVTDHQLVMSSVLADWGRLETVLRQASREPSNEPVSASERWTLQ